MVLRFIFLLIIALAWPVVSHGAEDSKPRAARSVHLGYPAPDAEVFLTSMVVEKSTPGSYFMACGWNTGYFGIQELGNGKKVIIFSVWDPTTGDDPNKVDTSERVECLFNDPEMRIKRFGGEGTGGQCMGDFEWNIGETNRFLVRAVPDGTKTAYSGFVFDQKKNDWRKLVTFRTRTGGQPLKGLYSFVEDFRRDYKSANEKRRASFGDGWVKPVSGNWTPLLRARFTASSAEWEARDTINAGLSGSLFFLETGGDTKNQFELRSTLERSPLDIPLPQFETTPKQP
ncbi:MAG: DUF3472 domain-containing protein [Verrucomicrobiales bacterium]